MGKMQDRNEAIQWLKEGKTYAWIVDEYKNKYNIETSPSMWANLRREEGLPRRIARNSELIPWEVKLEHRYAYPIVMLRFEARRREGFELAAKDEEQVDGWLRQRKAEGSVVHYEPDTEQGWFYVPRREGVDKDIIREPERKTTRKVPRAPGTRRADSE